MSESATVLVEASLRENGDYPQSPGVAAVGWRLIDTTWFDIEIDVGVVSEICT